VVGELGDKLDVHLKRATSDGFAGAVLVVKDGQVILSKGYVMANRERKIPVTVDTVFDIGSLVKQFTAAAILKLEMNGKLRVTDPISKYFKNVPPDKATMTIHHLLTHTAGFDAAIGGDYEVISRDEYIKRAFNAKLVSAPGKKYKYSNVGRRLLLIDRLLLYPKRLTQALFTPTIVILRILLRSMEWPLSQLGNYRYQKLNKR